MNENYSKLLEKLKNLKLRYAATGLKLELETEIISTAEIDLAQKLAKESGLCLTLKTSGCSAVSDIFLSKALGINNILSPMIESAYALEKFYENVKDIHADETPNLMFNIETITAYENIDKILKNKYIDKFSTIVFGRNDFCCSLGKTADFCDDNIVFNYICNVLQKIENTNLNLIVGGNITQKSQEFLQKINSDKFTHFETRKIVFDKKILNEDFKTALQEALEFELLWLELKSFKNPLDEMRTDILKKRLAL